MFLNFSSGIYQAGWFHDNTLDFYFGCAWFLSKPRHKPSWPAFDRHYLHPLHKCHENTSAKL